MTRGFDFEWKGASEALNVLGLSRCTCAFVNVHSPSHSSGDEWQNVAELKNRTQ